MSTTTDRILATLEDKRDYAEARANDALDRKDLSAHEYWARQYHTVCDLISNRNVANAARQARIARMLED